MPDHDRSTLTPAPTWRRAAIAAALVATVATLASRPAAGTAGENGFPVSVKAAPLAIAAGGQGELRLTITPVTGVEILAAPAPNNYTTPLSLILVASEGIAPLQPAYPEGKPVMEDGGIPYNKYVGPVIVKVPVKVAAETASGAHVLKGTLRYQAIRYGSFTKAVVLPVEVTVEVTAAKKGKSSEKGKQAAAAPESPAAPVTRR
jgi:hypothetical protein